MRNHRFLGTIISILLIVGMGIFTNIPHVRAALTPTLNLTNTGSAVQLSIHGDANSNIQMGYYVPGTSNQVNIGLIGTTDSNGNFSTVLGYGSYGIPAWSTVFVTINGVNSSNITWPGSGTGGTLNLSQTNVIMMVGQSITITSANGYNLSATVNNSIVSAGSNGYNQITIYGSSTGSATVTVCSSNAGDRKSVV